jgi:hypothetical protein
MTSFVFKKFNSFSGGQFQGISLSNQHLLIIDVHGSHVTLEAIDHAQQIGLNMIMLPSYTFSPLQPSHVLCFKTFKTIFKKERD